MKIVHVGSNSVHVQHFVAALKENYQITNHLIAEETCDFGGVDEELVVSYRTLSLRIILENKKRVKAFLMKERPDVLHIHQLNRLAYFVSQIAKSLKIPILSTAWGSDVLLIPQQNVVFKVLIKRTIKRSKIVTADAEIMIDAMKSLVPTGVEYQKVQYGIETMKGNEVKEKIIFSNRLHKPLYRIDQIVHYFADVHSEFPAYKLVVGATGDETETLKSLVKSYNLEESIEFVGWLTHDQNKDWYAKSAYYISIPSSDGTSVSLLEAISAGCIPIVSDLPANREWVEDGKTGIIEQKGSNPIARALTTSFGNHIEENSTKVDRLASRVYTIPQFISFYEHCING